MRMLTCAGTFLLLLPVCVAGEQEKFDSAARARAVAPFVEEQTVAVAHVDLTRVDFDRASALLGQLLPSATIAPIDLGNGAAVLRAGFKDVYFVVQLSGPDQAQNRTTLPEVRVIFPISSGADEKALRAALRIPEREGQRVAGALVFRQPLQGSPATAQPTEFQPVERPELAAAFEAAGDTAAQVILTPPKCARRVVEELMPQLPKELGGGPSTVFTHGIYWAAAGIDFPPHLALRLVIQSEDAAAAEALRAKLADLLRLASQLEKVRELLPTFDKAVSLQTPKVERSRLVLALDEKQQNIDKLLSVVMQPLESAHTAAARAQSMNNLKEITLALLNYESTYRQLPLPGNRSADGKPLLSWRVAVLPWLEQKALYDQFHLDEPWDSLHNRTLIDKMPSVYRLPASKIKEKGYTNYLLPVGNGAGFSLDKNTEIKDIRDGTAQTIALVEVDDNHAVPWTKPDDWQYDPENPTQGLAKFFNGTFNVAFFDGTIHPIPLSIDPQILCYLVERADGHATPADAVH